MDANRRWPFDLKLIKWGLREKKTNNTFGVFLEGEKLVSEALSAGIPFKAVWYTNEFMLQKGWLVNQVKNQCERVSLITKTLMKSTSDQQKPPGIIAVSEQPNFIFRQAGDPFSLIIVLNKVQDPGNLGAVIRTADYFGVDEIWLGPESADPYKPKSLRGSMGAIFRMPVFRSKSTLDRIYSFKDAGAQVWAAVAHDTEACDNIDATGSRILIIGGESQGVERVYSAAS